MKGAVNFSALNLYVSLNENEYFFDEGINKDQIAPDARGKCHAKYEMRISIAHTFPPIKICMKKSVWIAYKCNDLLVRGHEEAHALQYLGKLKYLFSEIGRKYGKIEMSKVMIKWLLERIKGNEDYIGHVGSVFALSERNMIKASKLTEKERICLIKEMEKDPKSDIPSFVLKGTMYKPKFSEVVNLLEALYKKWRR